MKAYTGCLLLAVLAAPGCLTIPGVNNGNGVAPVEPAAKEAKMHEVVQPEDVKEENTHEIAQRLSDEIEREQNTPPAGRR